MGENYALWSFYPNGDDTFLRTYRDYDKARAHADWLCSEDTGMVAGEVRYGTEVRYRVERPKESSEVRLSFKPRARPSALAA